MTHKGLIPTQWLIIGFSMTSIVATFMLEQHIEFYLDYNCCYFYTCPSKLGSTNTVATSFT